MTPAPLFQDRADAGRALAARLRNFRHEAPVVVGLPRGGVVVAFEVARELDAPLDVCVVRKLGTPLQPELGMGAVAEGDVVFVDEEMQRATRTTDEELAQIIREQRAEVAARVKAFRRGAGAVDVRGRLVIVVDDGIATGGTVRAALRALRARGASRLVLATPIAAAEALEPLTDQADQIVCLYAPHALHSVGLWYERFDATTENEVVELLDRAKARLGRASALVERDVTIGLGRDAGALDGHLTLPPRPRGVVLFAHGSGSSRHSPRNQLVARELQRHRLGTLLLDLLTEEEERDDLQRGHLRFDIELLASRLSTAIRWLRAQPALAHAPIGLFGASTGAAAALVAAGRTPEEVAAVVSRGGRPDLARSSLAAVHAPTLLLVGSEDPQVLDLNREALRRLACVKQLEVVPGASHLFEEPGTLEIVASTAATWFVRYLRSRERTVDTSA